MLYGVPGLDDDDARVLDEADAMRERLRLHLRASGRWEDQLRRNPTARAIAGSNTIEGYAASVADVEDIMLGEAPIEAGGTVGRGDRGLPAGHDLHPAASLDDPEDVQLDDLWLAKKAVELVCSTEASSRNL